MLGACGSPAGISWGDRDRAMHFYQQLNPVYTGLNQVVNEWSQWRLDVPRAEFEANLPNKCASYEGWLAVLYENYNQASLPQETLQDEALLDLKNSILNGLDRALEYFELQHEYATTGEQSVQIQAGIVGQELNSILEDLEDKWNAGISHYSLHTREFAIR